MDKQEILKNNRLIAKFMHRSFAMSHIDDYDGVPDNELPPMKYHSDWNWLMSVVEKIGDIYNQADIEMLRLLKHSEKEIDTTSIFCSKHIVYERVIEFIIWYNEIIINNDK